MRIFPEQEHFYDNTNSAFGDELAASMAQHLNADKVEASVKAEPKTEAINSLCKAADILQNLGDYKSVELITRLLEKTAKDV